MSTLASLLSITPDAWISVAGWAVEDEVGGLLPTSARGQALMVAGLGVLIWVLLRRHFKAQARSRQHDRDIVDQHRQWQRHSVSGAPLADAPPHLARWQAGMFDLQRDLKAELDGRIAVLQSVTRMADERIAQLNGQTINGQPLNGQHGSDPPTPPAGAKPIRVAAQQVEELTRRGLSAEQISRELGIDVVDVRFLQGDRV